MSLVVGAAGRTSSRVICLYQCLRGIGTPVGTWEEPGRLCGESWRNRLWSTIGQQTARRDSRGVIVPRSRAGVRFGYLCAVRGYRRQLQRRIGSKSTAVETTTVGSNEALVAGVHTDRWIGAGV